VLLWLPHDAVRRTDGAGASMRIPTVRLVAQSPEERLKPAVCCAMRGLVLRVPDDESVVLEDNFQTHLANSRVVTTGASRARLFRVLFRPVAAVPHTLTVTFEGTEMRAQQQYFCASFEVVSNEPSPHASYCVGSALKNAFVGEENRILLHVLDAHGNRVVRPAASYLSSLRCFTYGRRSESSHEQHDNGDSTVTMKVDLKSIGVMNVGVTVKNVPLWRNGNVWTHSCEVNLPAAKAICGAAIHRFAPCSSAMLCRMCSIRTQNKCVLCSSFMVSVAHSRDAHICGMCTPALRNKCASCSSFVSGGTTAARICGACCDPHSQTNKCVAPKPRR
jgi:hypothetical protein